MQGATVDTSLNKGAVESLLRETDVAKILNVSVVTIRQLRKRGGGPGFLRIGKSIRYSVPEINAFIERSIASTVEPAKKAEPIGLDEIFSKGN